jgi:hypothetical protein
MKTNVEREEEWAPQESPENSNYGLPGLETGWVPPHILLTPKDREFFAAIDRLKQLSVLVHSELSVCEVKLDSVHSSEAAELRLLVVKLRERFAAVARDLYPQIYQQHVEALERIYELRVQIDMLVRSRMDKIRSLKLYRAAHLGLKCCRQITLSAAGIAARLRRLPPIFSVQEPQSGEPSRPALPEQKKIRGMDEEHGFYQLQNPYADVDNRRTAFEIFRNWVTLFNKDGKRYGADQPLVHDQLETIYELNNHLPLAGKQILELGPLEGANTKQMLDLGATSVTAIESNRESFVKCLIAQNELSLTSVHFIFGDCNYVLEQEDFQKSRRFDICVASGILYHMENPLRTIDLITRVSTVVYVWSHVASDRSPAGEWLTFCDEAGHIYRGRKNEYRQSDALGGIGCFAVWLTPESLCQAFVDRGFHLQMLGTLQNYKGDAIKFIATKA